MLVTQKCPFFPWSRLVTDNGTGLATPSSDSTTLALKRHDDKFHWPSRIDDVIYNLFRNVVYRLKSFKNGRPVTCISGENMCDTAHIYEHYVTYIIRIYRTTSPNCVFFYRLKENSITHADGNTNCLLSAIKIQG